MIQGNLGLRVAPLIWEGAKLDQGEIFRFRVGLFGLDLGLEHVKFERAIWCQAADTEHTDCSFRYPCQHMRFSKAGYVSR